jgi:hypothetical protein
MYSSSPPLRSVFIVRANDLLSQPEHSTIPAFSYLNHPQTGLLFNNLQSGSLNSLLIMMSYQLNYHHIKDPINRPKKARVSSKAMHYNLYRQWSSPGPHSTWYCPDLLSHHATPPPSCNPRSSPRCSAYNQPSAYPVDLPFECATTRVRTSLVNLHTWADELPRLRRKCDQLYLEAKTAQMEGNTCRAMRRMEMLEKVLGSLDRDWKDAGLWASVRGTKAMLS